MTTATASPLVTPESYLTLHYRIGLVPSGEHARPDRLADGAVDDTATGDVVSTFAAQPATLQLGAGQLTPTLEARLVGLPIGAHRVFELAPGEAFGPRNGDLVRRVSRELLEAESSTLDYAPGDVVEFNAPGGGRYAGVFRDIDDDAATFDFNHPLAGQAVRFEVEIVGIL